MTATATRTDKLSRFVDEALLSPQQTREVVLTPGVKKDDKADTRGPRPTHAHGDFGHGDFGHADR
jgi:hypothetical protein